MRRNDYGNRGMSIKVPNYEDMDIEVDPSTEAEMDRQECAPRRRRYDSMESVPPRAREIRQAAVEKCMEYIANMVLRPLADQVGFRTNVTIYDSGLLRITMRLSREKITVGHSIITPSSVSKRQNGGYVSRYANKDEDRFFTYIYTIPHEQNGEMVGGFRIKEWIAPSKQCELFNIFLMHWTDTKQKLDTMRDNLFYATTEDFDPSQPPVDIINIKEW